MSFWSIQKSGFQKLLQTFNFYFMPSFDLASSVDIQALDNAVNVVKKEITNGPAYSYNARPHSNRCCLIGFGDK